MIIQRHFAVKGTDILYVDKDKADSVPESVWKGFKRQVSGEGDIKSFPQRVHVPVTEQGYFVDDSTDI